MIDFSVYVVAKKESDCVFEVKAYIDCDECPPICIVVKIFKDEIPWCFTPKEYVTNKFRKALDQFQDRINNGNNYGVIDDIMEELDRLIPDD